MPPAIQVRNLGKRYRIDHQSRDGATASYKTLRDSLMSAASAPLRKLRRGIGIPADESPPSQEDFWALQDVSFDVQPGEVVGIIGRNGAGKSTLLKILSRITKPSTGNVTLNGRVGSLLEVGTGFHPELTGRENIFLNGSILGMKRTEIQKQFDAIVDFSGVEKFLDTPVKRYSSGMYVRLAFSVAAHLEPEILIVDEVLAVGDLDFQKKCSDKMRDVATNGSTILLVSHNMSALRALCGRAAILLNGQLEADLPMNQAVIHYLKLIERAGVEHPAKRKDRRGRGDARLIGAQIRNPEYGDGAAPSTGLPVEIKFRVSRWLPSLTLQFTIYDMHGQSLCHCTTRTLSTVDEFFPPASGEAEVVWRSEELLLLPGRYRINTTLSSAGEIHDHLEGILNFDVLPGALRGRIYTESNGAAPLILPGVWTCGAVATAHEFELQR